MKTKEASPPPARRRVLSYANVTSTLALVLVLGGGPNVVGESATNNPLAMEESQPDTSNNAWAVTMENNVSSAEQFNVYAVCAKVGS
jgi:hypothetical protein